MTEADYTQGYNIVNYRDMKVTIIAHPNAKNPRVETDLLGTLHVYVNQPPLEGRANAAVRDALAEHFEVKKAKVLMVSGERSKLKIFEIVQI